MADVNKLAPFILSWEGGFVNDPKDRGGATNMGVTISTWKAQGYDKDGDGDIDVADLMLITKEDATRILKKNYWDRFKADQIKDQSVANILVDWLWGSGSNAIKITQQLLGVSADGIVGPKTIAEINKRVPYSLFTQIKERRRIYLYRIVSNNSNQRRFLKGWLRRLDSIKYGELVCNQ